MPCSWGMRSIAREGWVAEIMATGESLGLDHHVLLLCSSKHELWSATVIS
jgi:hypothetical protein